MSHRAIAPIAINGFKPGGVPRAQPIFEWVDPSTLLVDEGYQRDCSERCLKLVRKIVCNWDWARYKGPVAVMTDTGLELIDGQHTAIAAATHPDIVEIPVMIVEAPVRAERAAAFIGHNKDRIAVTAAQIHIAALAAGDGDAKAIADVATMAGVTILRSQKKQGYKPGETLAVSAIGHMVRLRGKAMPADVLTALVEGGCAPITQVHIKAADHLLNDAEFRGKISQETLSAVIQTMAPKIAAEVSLFRATYPSTPAWKAMAIVWFRNRRRTTKPAQNMPEIMQAASTSHKIELRPRKYPVGTRGKSHGPSASAADTVAAVPPTVYEDRPRVLAPPARKGESIADGAKHDDRPPLRGWRPGNHLRRCEDCGAPFVGHLRAIACADCAYRAEQVERAL
jgi:hypothetical protein